MAKKRRATTLQCEMSKSSQAVAWEPQIHASGDAYLIGHLPNASGLATMGTCQNN
jgi:hypothetical protein